MNRDTLPSEEEHYRMAKHVLRRCAPYTVVFRTFDLGADKPTKLLELEDERNPAMGMRSLRLALRERDMFLAQLRGFLRAGVHGPLAIMLPLVGGVDELGAGLDAIEEARDQLATAGVAHADDIDIGVATPAVAAGSRRATGYALLSSGHLVASGPCTGAQSRNWACRVFAAQHSRRTTSPGIELRQLGRLSPRSGCRSTEGARSSSDVLAATCSLLAGEVSP